MRPDNEKRTIAELGFQTWLKDVLWYHFKWYIIGVAAIILALALILFWQSQVSENDITVVLASSEELSFETQVEIKAAIGAYTGDVNGDGKIIVALTIINPQSGVYSGTQSGATALMTTIANTKIVLYIMDSVNTGLFITGNTDIFNKELADKYNGESCAIPLDGSYLFDSLKLNGYFAALKNKSFKVKESNESYYALALTVLEGIMSREQ
jgi:hypothetical protein